MGSICGFDGLGALEPFADGFLAGSFALVVASGRGGIRLGIGICFGGESGEVLAGHFEPLFALTLEEAEGAGIGVAIDLKDWLGPGGDD